MESRPRVVVVGGGFGGLQCAKALRGEPVDVLLVDQRDYHLFTPLLYQVASCLLNPSEIAAPLRKVFRGAPNVRYRQGEVVHVDLDGEAADARRRRGARVRRLRPRDRERHELLRQRRRSSEHALGLKDLGRGAPAPQPRARVLRAATTTDVDAGRDGALPDVLHRRRGADRRGVRRRARRVRAARGPARVPGAGVVAGPHHPAGGRRPRPPDVQASAVGLRARASSNRRGVEVRTRHAGDVGRRRAGSCCTTAPSCRRRRWSGPPACARPIDARRRRRGRIEVDDHFRVVGRDRRLRDR